MAGFGDHVALTGDWMPPPSPSPRAFFSSMIGDDFVARSITGSGSENKSESMRNDDEKDQNRASMEYDEASGSKVLFERKTSSRGGLMERMAARAGFNAPRLNTESIRPADLSKRAEVRSPYLTIPPGLSPTTLLESPVFLSNSLVQPSPTTGKFSLVLSGNNQNSALTNYDSDKGKENTFEDVNASSFAFPPVAESSSFPRFNALEKVNPSTFASQSFPSLGVPVASDTSVLRQSIDPSKVHFQNNNELFQQTNFSKSHAETEIGSNLSSGQTYDTVGVTEHSPPLDAPNEDDADQRSGGDPNGGGAPAEDGYNWRKYGQKHVKGSEFPRSYYKCTHPNCPVKKKVERSPEGHITEIIYKGAHNHSKPPPNRRSALGSSNTFGDMQLDSDQPGIGANGDHTWLNMQKGNGTGAPDWRQDGVEGTSSAALGQDYSNGAAFQAQNGGPYESVDGREGSSTFSNDEEEDQLTHGSVSLGHDGEGDESESKRRRIEAYASEMSGATRALREPRVVVQTTSEVDILDDGYRWRKYGQKVVKGNPNPRSYYKCTSAGCNVRKHVERASHDLKSVITTYEGKHNHDVPAARNSSHINNGGSNALSTRQAPAHGPDSSQIHGSMARFERHSLGAFGLSGRVQYGQGQNAGYGLNQLGLPGLGMDGFATNHGKLPVLPGHPYLGHPARPMSGMGFMVPKGEPKMEPVTDSGLNPSSSSSVYQQFMNRLPLGPQM